MFSKVVSFFDRSKKSKKCNFSNKNKNYDKKSMEWQDDDDDHRSIDSLSWIDKSILEKSRSDSSITAIKEFNYRTQGTQVSLETCNMQRNVTTALKNLSLNTDDEDDDTENDTFTISTKDYRTHNQFDYSLFRCGFRTQDITTKELVIQGPEILNFQGNRHSPQEVAPCWKKDCRMWLWKSVRLANRQNRIQSSIITKSQN